MGDRRGQGRVNGVVPQEFLDALEIVRRLLAALTMTDDLLLFCFLLGIQLLGSVHSATSGGLLKKHGEGFACAMKFTANSIRGLVGESANLIVTQLPVSHEQ